MKPTIPHELLNGFCQNMCPTNALSSSCEGTKKVRHSISRNSGLPVYYVSHMPLLGNCLQYVDKTLQGHKKFDRSYAGQHYTYGLYLLL